MTPDPRARRQPESILADDLRVDTRAQTDDGARLDRIVGGAMAGTAGLGALWLVVRSIATSKIAMVAVATASATAATAWVVARPSTPAAVVDRGASSRDDASTPAGGEPAAMPSAIEAPAMDPAVLAPVAEPSAIAEPPLRSDGPAARARPRANEPAIEAATLDADALLERAARARKDGRTDDAIAAYRELGRRFAGTREDAVGCVALARLLVGRDASDALAAFDRCLADHPRGDLVEAALVGRAQALAKLGRVADERAAWAELLRRFPSTLHAEHARSRTGE